MILLIYLLKLVSCTALFYSYYFFLLRNKRMHQYNRFYILASIILSIVLPLVKLPLLLTGNEDQVSTKLQGIAFGGWEDEIVITAKQGFLHSLITARNIIAAIYITGLLLALYPVIKSIAYIRLLSLQHKAEAFDSIRFYDTAEPGTPFSFFNTVFWNKNISIETEEGQQILRHELYHIKQKHSYDILFMQLACSLLWFNPFCYLISKELKVVHEFLADEYAASGTDRHHYAKLLVMQAISPKQVFISNQFFYNQIKRRINMILQNNTTQYSNFRKAMAVPVLLLIFCACSVKNKDEIQPSKVVRTETNKASEKVDSIVITAPAKDDQEFLHATGNDVIFSKAEIEPDFPQGRNGWMRYLNKTFRYPQEAQEKEIQGTVVVQFVVDKEGNVSNVEAVNGTTEGGLREEAVRVIKASGKWLPAVENGHKVKCYKKQTITFKLEAE